MKRMPYAQAIIIGSSTTDPREFEQPREDKKKKEYQGFCTSYKCTEIQGKERAVKGKKKPVIHYSDRVFKTDNKHVERCSDCGYYLVFFPKGEVK